MPHITSNLFENRQGTCLSHFFTKGILMFLSTSDLFEKTWQMYPGIAATFRSPLSLDHDSFPELIMPIWRMPICSNYSKVCLFQHNEINDT